MSKKELLYNLHAMQEEIRNFRDESTDEKVRWYYDGQLAMIDIIEMSLNGEM